MPVKKNMPKKVSTDTPSSTMNAAQLKEWYNKNQNAIELYAKSKSAVKQLTNPTKTEARSYTTFSRDKLRSYLKNPASNYKALVELSRYLYTRSNPYKKLICYNATMINTSYRAIVPHVDITKSVNKKKVLKQFYDTCTLCDGIDLQGEILKMLIIAWREDTAFGCIYYDKTGFFILPLPYDYCKVDGIYSDGSLGFSMDMSYFTNRQEQLNYYGDPFISMYKAYQKDTTNGKYQPIPDENCFCIKINIDDPTLPFPPYTALFNSIINLCDTEDLQASKDKASIYKLLNFRLDTQSQSNDPDDFTVDPETAIEYFNRAIESLPEYVDAIISPLKIDAITFQDDQAKDVNIIEDATKTLYNSSGGAQVLNSSTVSGTTAWSGAITSDVLFATGLVRPQIQTILNRWIKYQISDPAFYKLLPVTPYDRKQYLDQLTKEATYGLPVKLTLNALNGFSEVETLSMNALEEDCLNLSQKFAPLKSSNTQSDKTSGTTKGEVGQGAPTKDDTELTDSGAETKDKEKNTQ